MPLIEKYRDPTGERVFRFLLIHHDVLNLGLKEIVKYLKWTDDATFIWLRYSWPNIARNDCGVPMDDLGQAMNHSDNNHKVTDIYLTKSWNIIDNANRKVLNELSRVSLLQVDKISNAVT
ncbi:MAG: tyrosine-type recombinase/integrase [Mucilaginibacter sp.]|nr:tyrosine-type recombinase/integrase [Mucilaginibacter sp.]